MPDASLLNAYAITAPTEADIAAVAATMRAADVAEVWASHRVTPEQALRISLCQSMEAWTVSHAGRPLCLCGVGRLTDGTLLGGPVSVPWLLGSDALSDHRRALLRISGRMVPLWRRRHGLLVNWVDARNRASLRWLRWLGFEIAPAAPFGPDGLPFHRFMMR
ncbi:hypothetical protein [Novispirillum itersonii]|uniref:hypothetical protein n=1 Tax=Novispirillum itersonii TaxID=189 RepID=UPI000360236F|nr:hypothetical protein [Novispirillum itersonii]